ncbi:Zinc transport system ATP-binding protein [Candidatus Magnetaquicoccaceae bacterium FCR-1]|uniref:Zinc transport system ATP-binding protein n=1 Tax=Candidatus Magnetaquiglobus chichijimensis TaxID=3141448 RepID=A0ABQ0C8Z4_9PROT
MSPPGADQTVPLLSAHGLSVTLGGETLLREIDLAVHEREIVTIIGPNGAGKSTLLSALLGLIPLSGGSVGRRSGLVIGYVPQRLKVDAVLPMTVARFIALSAIGTGVPDDTLRLLGCDRLLERPLYALSGGEMQRVLMARALSRNPHLLVLDEPAQGLDLAGEEQLHRFIETLRRERGVAALLVSHDLHFVMAGADRVICLNRHVCCSGSPTAVRATPEFQLLFGDRIPGVGYYQHHHDHCHTPHGVERERP